MSLDSTSTDPVMADSRGALVFLDFDEVICLNEPYGGNDLMASEKPDDLWERLFHKPAVETLERILIEFEPRVVITTSWLWLMERGGFEALFAKCGMCFVAARLHEAWEAPQLARATRLHAIERWLSVHHRGEPFVVLDDVMSGTGLTESQLAATGRVVLCEVGVGLHAGHLAQVRQALRTPVRSLSGGSMPASP